MKIKKIDIRVENDWWYERIALLVDRRDFLEDVGKIRSTYKLVTTSQESYIKSRRSSLDKRMAERATQAKVNNGPRWYFTGDTQNLHVNFAVYSPNDIEKEAEKLVLKYKKSGNFLNVILYSVVSGYVVDSNTLRALDKNNQFTIRDSSINPYIICRFDHLFNKEGWGPTEDIHLEKHEAAIILYPDTTIKEIERVFNLYRTTLKDARRTVDTISNIRRDREWYWKNINDSSYENIYMEELKKGTNITLGGISKAIQQYKRRLSVEL